MVYTYYNPNGEIVNSEQLCVCKKVEYESGREAFFIKSSSGEFFDPQATSTQYNNRLWKFKKVSNNQFSIYMRYLTSKKKTHYLYLERMHG